MRCMPIAVRVEGASRGAFEIRTSRDAISVPLLQKTLHDAVYVHPPYQDRASRRARKVKNHLAHAEGSGQIEIISQHVPRIMCERVPFIRYT